MRARKWPREQGRNTGGVWGGACTPPASLPNKILPKFTQLLPNITQQYPTFTQLLPNFTQLLPNITQLLPNFTQLLPNITQFYLPQNFFRAFGAKTLPNSKIFTQLHPPWKSELLRPCPGDLQKIVVFRNTPVEEQCVGYQTVRKGYAFQMHQPI